MIEEFLRSGHLGALRLGLTRDDVRRLLGEPPDYSEKNEIWKYGSLQLTFSGNWLSLIGVYFEDGVLNLPPIVQDGKLTLKETSVKGFERFLRAQGIDFTVKDSLTFDDQKALHIPASHVNVTFSEGRLHSMQLRVS